MYVVTFIFYLLSFIFCSVAPLLSRYLFMLPTFINIFTIYSFCNMHDLSWGTKDISKSEDHGGPKISSHADAQSAIVQSPDEATQQKANREIDKILRDREKKHMENVAATKEQTNSSFRNFRTAMLVRD